MSMTPMIYAGMLKGKAPSPVIPARKNSIDPPRLYKDRHLIQIILAFCCLVLLFEINFRQN